MEFGDNIINRTIQKTFSKVMTAINDKLGTHITIAFPLGIISGLLFVYYFDSYANPLLKKFIEPGDVAVDVTTRAVQEKTNVNPVEVSDKHGISIPGIIASLIAIPFFGDQFLSGILIGIGISIIPVLPYVGIFIIGMGAILEYYVAYKSI